MEQSYPCAAGTFLQADMASDWDCSVWKEEFRYLKEAGHNFLVLSGLTKTSENLTNSYYPTALPGCRWENAGTDTVENCLKCAMEAGFKVFLGINFTNAWWQKGASDPFWLYEQMERGNIIAGEMFERYYSTYADSFYGWYWEYEIDNLRFRQKKQLDVLARAINVNLSYLEKKKARLPVLFSPFMNKKYCSAGQYADDWAYLFGKTGLVRDDVLCPQDCVGAGGLATEDVRTWFAALAQAAFGSGLRFWANVETFTQYDWSSTVLKQFIRQMENVHPFTDTILTFSYSHYYSPNNIQGDFHAVYLDYLKKGFLEDKTPPSPEDVVVQKVGHGKILIRWEAMSGIYGYQVYRGKKLIYTTKVQRKYGAAKPGPVCSCLDNVYSLPFCHVPYHVTAFDFVGNFSTTHD